MARSKPSTKLSQAEIECFLTAAEALHKSIVKIEDRAGSDRQGSRVHQMEHHRTGAATWLKSGSCE
ncbi:hypothetical protein [Mesorhizobium jarvisii]|uniref:hypothetical protein n=1 Tax=Mesorhizobium jarvisii TaxID=1777867 RepID=UPI00142DD2B2|nr:MULTISPECIES: hypothetical protein [Mesorhizobium]